MMRGLGRGRYESHGARDTKQSPSQTDQNMHLHPFVFHLFGAHHVPEMVPQPDIPELAESLHARTCPGAAGPLQCSSGDTSTTIVTSQPTRLKTSLAPEVSAAEPLTWCCCEATTGGGRAVQVSAGCSFPVLLRSDGRVAECGINRDRQCEIKELVV